MSDQYQRIQKSHRPVSHIFSAKFLSVPRKGNSSSSIASALIRYNRNQLDYNGSATSERLGSGNQSPLKINRLHGETRQIERPKTTSSASRNVRREVVSMSAEYPSSPNYTGLVLSRYPAVWSRGQIQGKRFKQSVFNMRQKGDIEVRLVVVSREWTTPETGELISRLYKHLLRDKTMYLNQLNSNKLIRGIKFKDMRQGSLILVANCASLRDLSVLEEIYSAGELGQVLGKTLLTTKLYRAVGYEGPDLQLDVKIDESDIEVCKKGLSSLTRSLKLHGLDGGTFVSRTDCMKEVAHLMNKITSLQVSLNGEYNTFLNNLTDFFTVLKLTKPVELTSFSTLADVQWCDTYIKSSPSVGKELHTKPVHDFLQLVQYIGTEVEHISKEFNHWETSFLKYLDVEHIKAFKDSMAHIKRLLQPAVKFADLDFSISMPMTVLERQIFADLVKYIPALQTGVYDMGNHMSVLTDKISLNSSHKSTEHYHTPRTSQAPVALSLKLPPERAYIQRQAALSEKMSQERDLDTAADCEKILPNQNQTENAETKSETKVSSRSRTTNAVIIPCGVTEPSEEGTCIEDSEDATNLPSDTEQAALRSPSLTSETMEHQLRVTIVYKTPQKHACQRFTPHLNQALLSKRKNTPIIGKRTKKEKPHSTRRQTTADMARKLELALSQKRKFEYESVSNITHLLPK